MFIKAKSYGLACVIELFQQIRNVKKRIYMRPLNAKLVSTIECRGTRLNRNST
ncbi:MAG: hypothetical protein ACI9WL_000866 [Rubritalea sp.]|jgi:hypothetical protein